MSHLQCSGETFIHDGASMADAFLNLNFGLASRSGTVRTSIPPSALHFLPAEPDPLVVLLPLSLLAWSDGRRLSLSACIGRGKKARARLRAIVPPFQQQVKSSPPPRGE